MISVLIPSKNEPYLEQTIKSVNDNAAGEVEVIPVLDRPMRDAINHAASIAKSDYLMKLDAHCLVAKGFDQQLLNDHQPNWVQIPRRYRLDAEKWEIIEDGRPPVDYEHIVFSNLITDVGIGSRGFIWGAPWDKQGPLIDDTMHFQGSCWFMTKEWFSECGFMDTSYGGFAQESEEILFETIKRGGRVVTNKNTYYAHLHKNKEQRKWFEMPSEELKTANAYSYNKWVRDHRDLFERFVSQFEPIPGWPKHWQKILWQD